MGAWELMRVVNNVTCMDLGLKIIEFHVWIQAQRSLNLASSRRVTRISRDFFQLTNIQIFVILKYARSK